MRIWAQLPSQRPSDVVGAKAYVDLIGKVKHPDTEVSFYPMPPGPSIPGHGAFDYYGMRFLNDREILRAVARAEAENYDAAVIICWFDPAVRAARQLLSIPVIGVAEASMLLACTMGLRFAVVTSSPGYVGEMNELLRLYGLASRAIEVRPVRPLRLSEDEFANCISRDVNTMVKAFLDTAQGCIEDGADTIIFGCTLMGSFLSRAGVKQIQGVPVIDPVLAGIKMAETLVGFKRADIPAVSRRGYFEEVPAEMMEQARASGLL